MSKHQGEIDAFMDSVRAKQAHETEFLQAVEEVAEAVIPFIADKPQYKKPKFWKEWLSRKEQLCSVCHG